MGEKEGKGKIFFSSSGGLIYDGGWRNNMPDGEGYKYNEQGKKIGVFYKDGINILNLRSDNFVKWYITLSCFIIIHAFYSIISIIFIKFNNWKSFFIEVNTSINSISQKYLKI